MDGHDDSKLVSSLTTCERWKQCLHLNPQFKWSLVLTVGLVVIFLFIDIGIAASKPGLRSPKAFTCDPSSAPAPATLEAIALEYSAGWHGEWSGGDWSFTRICPSNADVRTTYLDTLQSYTRRKGGPKDGYDYSIMNCNDEEMYKVYDPQRQVADIPWMVGEAPLTIKDANGVTIAVANRLEFGQLDLYPPTEGTSAFVSMGFNANGSLFVNYGDCSDLPVACDPRLVGAVFLHNTFSVDTVSGNAPGAGSSSGIVALLGRDGCNDFYYVTMALVITIILIGSCVFGIISYNWYRQWKIRNGAYAMQLESQGQFS